MSEPKIKDCCGHEGKDDLSPATRACKAYVALCCGAGDYHDPYMDCGDIDAAIVDMMADLIHLADHEDIDFAKCIRVAVNHANEERRDWLNIVKANCIEQAVDANLT